MSTVPVCLSGKLEFVRIYLTTHILRASLQVAKYEFKVMMWPNEHNGKAETFLCYFFIPFKFTTMSPKMYFLVLYWLYVTISKELILELSSQDKDKQYLHKHKGAYRNWTRYWQVLLWYPIFIWFGFLFVWIWQYFQIMGKLSLQHAQSEFEEKVQNEYYCHLNLSLKWFKVVICHDAMNAWIAF